MHIDEELFRREDFKRNLKLYEESVKNGKPVFMDIDDMTDIIDYYNYDGRTDEATAMADYALELYPGAIGPLVFKARLSIANNDIPDAISQCEAIEDKSDIDYFYLRVELEIAQNHIEQAEKIVEEAYANTEPDDKDNFLLDIGALYLDYNVVDEAEKWLDKMKNKEHNERLELVSRIYSSRFDFANAIDTLEKLIDKNPFIYRYWNMLALIHLCVEDFDECRNSAEYSLAINPENTDGLWFKAKALQGQGKMEEAVDAFDKFLQHMPNCAKAEMEMGVSLLQMNDDKKAQAYMEKAIAHGQDDPTILAQVYDDLAFIYSGRKDIDNALKCLDNAETYADQSDDIHYLKHQRTVLRGHIYLMNGETELGMKTFGKALKESEHDPEIILKIMVSLYEHQFYDEVITYFRKLQRAKPEGWNAGYSYVAGSYIKKSDMANGLKYLKKACLVNPDEVELVFGNFFPPSIAKEDFYDFVKNFKLK